MLLGRFSINNISKEREINGTDNFSIRCNLDSCCSSSVGINSIEQRSQNDTLILCRSFIFIFKRKQSECLYYMALAMRSDGTANISANKKWKDVCRFQIKAYLCIRNSGCSSARLEYASGGRVVAGSNPVTPTGKKH